MKISIYEESAKAEKEYRLRLFRIGDGIVVALVDENGEKIDSSSLVSITSDMELVRCCNINSFLGLPLISGSKLKMKGTGDES